MRSLHSSSCSLINLRQMHEQSRVKPLQWIPHRPFAPASATPRHASLGDRIAMRGILDSWKNMTSRDDSSQSQATISIDDDEPCPLECVRQVYKGAASGSEIAASSAEEARREARRKAARERQNARDLALVFGPAGAKLPPELEEEELESAEEEAMARHTPAHANNRKAGIKAPSSDGQAAQQALTSSKGKAALKKNVATQSPAPAATTAAAAAAGDQADAEAPESSAKAASACDGATAPRSSKSGAEKQKSRADQAGTPVKAAAPAQAKTATPSAQVESVGKKKKSKKSKADQVDFVRSTPRLQISVCM